MLISQLTELALCVSSRWIVTQQNSNTLSAAANDREEDFGQYPSYQDSLNEIFGCKHYKRNCKLLAACCSKLFTCIKCHDEFTDHSMERFEFFIYIFVLLHYWFFLLYLFTLSMSCVQKSYYKNDVHEMLGNSTSWPKMLKQCLQ